LAINEKAELILLFFKNKKNLLKNFQKFKKKKKKIKSTKRLSVVIIMEPNIFNKMVCVEVNIGYCGRLLLFRGTGCQRKGTVNVVKFYLQVVDVVLNIVFVLKKENVVVTIVICGTSSFVL